VGSVGSELRKTVSKKGWKKLVLTGWWDCESVVELILNYIKFMEVNGQIG